MQVLHTSQVLLDVPPKIMFKYFPTFAAVRDRYREISAECKLSRNALSPLSQPEHTFIFTSSKSSNLNLKSESTGCRQEQMLALLGGVADTRDGATTLDHSPVLNQIWNSWQKNYFTRTYTPKLKSKYLPCDTCIYSKILLYIILHHQFAANNSLNKYTNAISSVDEVKYTN